MPLASAKQMNVRRPYSTARHSLCLVFACGEIKTNSEVQERRYELMFEGMRFNDLRRWCPETAGEIIQKNQDGGYIEFKGVPTVYKELPGRGPGGFSIASRRP